MKITGVIPARYRSSRFPGKPLAEICGRPMIWWVYRQAEKVGSLDELLVATDDRRIFDCCRQSGMNVMMTGTEHPTGTDRLGEVARHSDADFFVNIQGDEPLIEPEVIQAIVDCKIRHPETDVINTMTAVREGQDVEDPALVKVAASGDGRLLYLSRAAVPRSKKGEKVAYRKHLGLYGLSKEALLFFSGAERTSLEKTEDIEMLRFLENGWEIRILDVVSESIGVDRPGDIAEVEAVMKRLERDNGQNA